MINQEIIELIPENLRDEELFKVTVNVFMDYLRENCAITLDPANLFDENNPILFAEILKIYARNFFETIEKAKSNLNLQRQLVKQYKNYGMEYDVENLKLDITKLLTIENINLLKNIQQSKGTTQTLSYIHDIFAKLKLEGDLLTSGNYFDVKETGNLLEYQVNSDMFTSVFETFVKPLAHPVGWKYVFKKFIQNIFTDYLFVDLTYNFDAISIESNTSRLGDSTLKDDFLKNTGWLFQTDSENKAILNSKGFPVVYEVSTADGFQINYPVKRNGVLYTEENPLLENDRILVKEPVVVEFIQDSDNTASGSGDHTKIVFKSGEYIERYTAEKYTDTDGVTREIESIILYNADGTIKKDYRPFHKTEGYSLHFAQSVNPKTYTLKIKDSLDIRYSTGFADNPNVSAFCGCGNATAGCGLRVFGKLGELVSRAQVISSTADNPAYDSDGNLIPERDSKEIDAEKQKTGNIKFPRYGYHIYERDTNNKIKLDANGNRVIKETIYANPRLPKITDFNSLVTIGNPGILYSEFPGKTEGQWRPAIQGVKYDGEFLYAFVSTFNISKTEYPIYVSLGGVSAIVENNDRTSEIVRFSGIEINEEYSLSNGYTRDALELKILDKNKNILESCEFQLIPRVKYTKKSETKYDSTTYPYSTGTKVQATNEDGTLKYETKIIDGVSTQIPVWLDEAEGATASILTTNNQTLDSLTLAYIDKTEIIDFRPVDSKKSYQRKGYLLEVGSSDADDGLGDDWDRSTDSYQLIWKSQEFSYYAEVGELSQYGVGSPIDPTEIFDYQRPKYYSNVLGHFLIGSQSWGHQNQKTKRLGNQGSLFWEIADFETSDAWFDYWPESEHHLDFLKVFGFLETLKTIRTEIFSQRRTINIDHTKIGTPVVIKHTCGDGLIVGDDCKCGGTIYDNSTLDRMSTVLCVGDAVCGYDYQVGEISPSGQNAILSPMAEEFSIEVF